MDIQISNSPLERIHRALEAEIDRGVRRIERAEKNGDPEYLDSVIDDECDEVEELLGIGFVAGQSFVNRVKSRLISLNRVCQDDFGGPLALLASGKSPHVLLKYGGTFTETQFSAAEIVNGVANYWKHADEWTTCEVKANNRYIRTWDVSKMSPIQKGTVELVSALGLSPGSTGNLRDAAKIMGITKYQDLTPMRKELMAWAKNVYDMAAADLNTLLRKSGRRSGKEKSGDNRDS